MDPLTPKDWRDRQSLW